MKGLVTAIFLLVAGCVAGSGVSVNQGPMTSEEMRLLVLELENLGVDSLGMIEDEQQRELWTARCNVLAKRIVIDNTEGAVSLAEFCDLGVEVLD